MREVFSKVTWREVKAADVVLMPWGGLTEPVEALVVGVESEPDQADRPVHAHIEAIGEVFPRWPFDPNAVVYVKARF